MVGWWSKFADAEVVELADALRSGRSGLYARVGSTPTFGTNQVGIRAGRSQAPLWMTSAGAFFVFAFALHLPFS